MAGIDSDTIGKSHIWLFDYYQEKSCRKTFNQYNNCLVKHGDLDRCEDNNRKCGNCVSGFWHSLNTNCRPLITKESVDESGHFTPDFVNKFDSCLSDISQKDISANSTLMAPNPENEVNLESSLPMLGMIFARRACFKASEDYNKCRKSNDVHSCAEAGKEFSLCNMKFNQSVVPNCINSVTSFYQAKMAQNESATPPTNSELSKQYFNCLVSSQNNSTS